MNQLSQLKQHTVVVADTGDFESLKAYTPRDATTNPTLIFKAVQMQAYQNLLDKAIMDNKSVGLSEDALVKRIVDTLLVLFGQEITKIVPGRVSTEVDARLSFDTERTVDKARFVISLYESLGISRERVLIKIASTWEGIKAAEILKKDGIACNLTLLFSLPQAIAVAEAGVKLISPFVGRILDWHKAKYNKTYTGVEDPGVQSVKQIYCYYKKFGYTTEIMGASFRNIDEIRELAGCDLLTISPNLLAELQSSQALLERKLTPEMAHAVNMTQIHMDEKTFRWLLNEDAMATEKLAEGIRVFASDINQLEALIIKKLS